MFKQKTTGGARNTILQFDDRGGDECSLSSFDFGDVIEIKMRGHDEYIALDKAMAIEFAKKILELTK